MFYEVKAKAHVRVPPVLLGEDVSLAIATKLEDDLEGYISSEAGFVIGISEILGLGEGIMVHGDGAIFYESEFGIRKDRITFTIFRRRAISILLLDPP